ncbi:putative DEAD box helicase involved in nonsense mediated decay [Aspergillus lucknowensis]|uniref:P-loop containing nucleoside triphosphate hydrolase protein n=1 Tax=Aspergillus lucknowensis TaxID=176173 RepID=A0ABR4LVI4_9EURO
MDSEDEVDSLLPEKFKKTTINRHAIAPANKEIEKYFDQSHVEDPDTWTSRSWTLKPEIPSSEEIFGTDGEFVDLVPNKLDGPWESKDAYLKAHYELLREDAVAPLRDAVAIVRNDPEMRDSKHVAIYEKVYVIGLTFARRGLGFRIRFSTYRAGKNISWEYSKRLVSGSMVALSPAEDAFQTKCVIAIVAARPLEGVKQQPPEVDIFFANPADADFDPQLEWIMVEPKEGYYESARHTMAALQKMSRESFPLADHICFLDREVKAPEYMKTNPIVDIGPVIHNSEEEVKMNILDAWPRSPKGDLDTTQWAALEQMLTKQLAVIQGPPGTGKTYVSVVALRTLLSNMKPGDPPIVVASQTNHALDQILAHISRFERQYVRLGARSSDPDIKKRTLYSIRRDEPMPSVPGSRSSTAHKSSKNLSTAIASILQPFNVANSHTPLPSSVFQKYGVLTAKQCDSLEKGAKRWVTAGEEEDIDPLVTWLGDQAVEFEVNYTMENFGFAEDEVDLEYEQLKELEAEQGLNDDDEYEILRGSFTSLQESYIGRMTSSDAGNSSWEYFDCNDMWTIPVKDRGRVYNGLREELKGKVLHEFRQLLERYSENCKSLQIGAWERDNLILQNAKVLGMTTTGLSKYRALISSVNPRIVLIEEAAEAIEAPIAAACLDSLQQLILVGDHQQLRGHCSVQDLEGEPFNLDVSMFERLVRNGMKYVTLQRQRRMAPEIRQLLSPIYGPLEDHESVMQREEVPGMGNLRVFFFSHDWIESFDDMASKYNEKEAEMIVGFFVHLVLNNVAVKDITILTFYNGQRKRLLRLMKAHPYLQGHYVKVVTVDSYQGEENEVVILSLVRNGRQGIGFLSIANRVCVALSRARRGFYMFGNSELLAAADPLWARVLSVLRGRHVEPRVGYNLPLTCVKHKHKTYIKDPADWKRSNGGCELICGEILQCGHKCSVRCHSFSHDQVQCTEICNHRMVCQHICKSPCSVRHACSCNCEESRRLESPARPQPRGLGGSWIIADDSERCDSKQRAAIESYQAYANGGSKEQDAILEQRLDSQQQQQQQQQQRKHPMNPKSCLLDGYDAVGDLTPAQSGFHAQEERDGSNTQLERSLLDDW